MKKYFFYIIILIAISCKKDIDNVFVPYNNIPFNDTTWSNTANSYRAIAQKIIVDFGKETFTDTTFIPVKPTLITKYFDNGKYKLSFVSDAVKFPNSPFPFNGAVVNISILPIVKRGDFIANYTNTSYNNYSSISIGAFDINITYNNIPLSIDTNKLIQFSFTDTVAQLNINPVNAYIPSDTATTAPNFSWFYTNYNSLINEDTIQGKISGYTIGLNKLGFFNYLSNLDSLTIQKNLTVSLPLNFTNSNSVVYVISNTNKLVQILSSNYTNRNFVSPPIPLQGNYTLVSISYISNNYYIGTATINFTNPNIIYSVSNQVLQTSSYLKTYLKSLF